MQDGKVIKIFVVGGDVNYVNFIKNKELVDNPVNADLVVFTGGEDVTPSFYGCEAHGTTYYNMKRDLVEKKIFESLSPNQVCLGICRGSQFLCVMNGGLLVQNVSNHGIWGTHPIINKEERVYEITSTHHQMQYPYILNSTKDYEILFTSYPPRSSFYQGDNIDSGYIATFGEPEIVLYHKENTPVCLAVQGHPEMIPNSEIASYINDYVNKLINKDE